MKRIPLTPLLFSVTLSVMGMEGGQSDYQVHRPMELQQKLHSAYLAKGILYKPRTEHLDADGTPVYINRLILEDSPYLLQHAHNPVDWHPWSAAAFEKAKRENKPIFLSIGYSTCHWCHVMERESFENPDIAKVLNEHFIAVKVDRESHPQVDETYMMAVMLMTGHGGWPMSSFLTPDGRPFFGGTYYPPQQFFQLLHGVIEAWQQRHDEVLQQAEHISAAVSQANEAKDTARTLDNNVVQLAVTQMLSNFDELQGGFGQAPKFPHEPWLFLLLNHVERHHDSTALKVLETTLDAMARGGIYDQVGGGFHRYATDHDWLVPHFEKMLYNQAHLARIYLHAWRLTAKEQYRRIVTQTLDYVLREMTNDSGAFYSATDADSEGKEGAFFIWTPDEIRNALPKKEAELAIELYGITQGGNFEGKNILHLSQSLEAFAKRKKIDPDELRSQVDKIDQQLRTKREKREHPLRDDKIVTAWNGMMISALTQAGQVLDTDYGKAAERAAAFLWSYNRKAQGKLWRVNVDGRSSIDAVLEDYAYLAEGLLHLYDLNRDRDWLLRAAELADAADRRFSDNNGSFYLSEADGNLNSMGRPRDGGGDNAIPSGSSVMLRVLQMLAERTGEQKYKTRADRLIAAYSADIASTPSGYGYMLTALDDLRNGELSAQRYAARGGIRLGGTIQKQEKNEYLLTIELDIPEGWHINAHQPLDDNLVATDIELKNDTRWKLASVSYPNPVKRQLDFQLEPLLVYEGKIHIHAIVNADRLSVKILPISIRLQACNNETCLPPEIILLAVPLQTSDLVEPRKAFPYG